MDDRDIPDHWLGKLRILFNSNVGKVQQRAYKSLRDLLSRGLSVLASEAMTPSSVAPILASRFFAGQDCRDICQGDDRIESAPTRVAIGVNSWSRNYHMVALCRRMSGAHVHGLQRPSVLQARRQCQHSWPEPKLREKPGNSGDQRLQGIPARLWSFVISNLSSQQLHGIRRAPQV